METISETIHGAAEGLQHGTAVLTGHAKETVNTGAERTVTAKEDTRNKLHEMTMPPTPSNPSVSDTVKEKYDELTAKMGHFVSGEDVPRASNPSITEKIKESYEDASRTTV